MGSRTILWRYMATDYRDHEMQLAGAIGVVRVGTVVKGWVFELTLPFYFDAKI